MSKENVTAFIDKAKSDPSLQGKLRKLPGEESSAIKEVVKIAAGAGYHFSEQEYRNAAKDQLQSGELQEDDLAKVSGGTIISVVTIVVQVTLTVCRR